ncbi:MAG: hypothetical protein HOO88_05885 [Kiritimatiellaceae bacterium]|nr:hypothetical protein [Kiritimatiellaceae bacterium]
MSIEKYVPAPDFNNILAVLQNKRPARPTLFEFYLNWPLYQQFAGPLPPDCPEELQKMLTTILGFRNLGYDYASIKLPNFTFQTEVGGKGSKASYSLNEGSVIHDRESFKANS